LRIVFEGKCRKPQVLELAGVYPDAESKEITARLAQLNEMVAKVSDVGISSAVARSYISNGDFWVSGNERKFTIDSSWLPMIELANEWYDRVIKEFPGSDAAEIAYERRSVGASLAERARHMG
jgi:hypothetical protein